MVKYTVQHSNGDVFMWSAVRQFAMYTEAMDYIQSLRDRSSSQLYRVLRTESSSEVIEETVRQSNVQSIE